MTPLSENRLTDKRCLITGGSRGLGAALAHSFADAGAKVAFTYRSSDDEAAATEAALRDKGREVLVFRGSVGDADHVRQTVRAIGEAWGGIDILVNNAGPTQVLPVALLEEEDWDEVMNTNVKGAFLFARAVLKSMIRARAGHILNIGNFGSERILEAPIHYAAAKSALRGLTESLAREVGRYNIRVNLLSPGLMESGLSKILPQHRIDEYLEQCPMSRLATNQEIAALSTFLVSDDNTFMTGAKIVADGGL